MEFAGGNAFAEALTVSVRRAAVGTDILLRNEPDAARRVQVVRSGEAAVEVGDVLVAADGHALPLRANAVELEDTLNPAAPPPGARADIALGLWRVAPEAFLGIGTEVAVVFSGAFEV